MYKQNGQIISKQKGTRLLAWPETGPSGQDKMATQDTVTETGIQTQKSECNLREKGQYAKTGNMSDLFN